MGSIHELFWLVDPKQKGLLEGHIPKKSTILIFDIPWLVSQDNYGKSPRNMGFGTNKDGVLDATEFRDLFREVKKKSPKKKRPPSPFIDISEEPHPPSPLKRLWTKATSGISCVKDGFEVLVNSKAAAAAVKAVDRLALS